MPIGEYGVVGDTRTAALISPEGAVDWLCLPQFDAAPVFGALVGGAHAGTFRVAPAPPHALVGRAYEGPTVLTSMWRTAASEVVLRDAMVANFGPGLFPSSMLVRQVEVVGEPIEVEVTFDPVRNGRQRPAYRTDHGSQIFHWNDGAMSVCTSEPLPLEGSRPRAVVVEQGAPLTIVVSWASRQPAVAVPPVVALQAVADDQRWWQSWCDSVSYHGPWREAVVRSLLTLKLLTFSPSGAPVAAVSSSLPEQLGGAKNWDYRYAWLRDAAIGVATFLKAGLRDEARSFFYWLLHATRLSRPRLPPALTLFGNPLPAEVELDWPGYANSRPVRLGNVVGAQRQLDVYGFVLDAASVLTQHDEPLFGETWRALRGAADHVAKTWRQPGAGVWEERGQPRQWVVSKLMAWLGLDRAERIGRARGESARRLAAWQCAKVEMRSELFERGFDKTRRSFVREYGEAELDGALLLLPLIGLEPVESPAVIGTVDAVRRELDAGGPLLFRHGDRDEGAFVAVSFWMAQALACIGRVDEAETLMEEMVNLASPLGLFAEEIDPSTRQMLGNHPQALSHAALLQAAFAIRDARSD